MDDQKLDQPQWEKVTADDQPRGIFVVFEGGDACGKTTQIKMFEEYLDKHAMAKVSLKFPDRTSSIGVMINSYLQERTEMPKQAIHLLFSADRWLVAGPIREHIKAGTHVVGDRYGYSGVAYSVAKDLDPEWCKSPDKGLPRPDLVVFLKVSAREAMARKGRLGETERYENVKMQTKVGLAFDEMCDPTWAVIDGTLPKEAIHDLVVNAFSKVRGSIHREPLGDLWAQ